MRKGELLLDKSVKKYYSSYFTGGELKHRDALLFAQGYNSLIDVLKRVWINVLCGLVRPNVQTLLFFLSISYCENLERTAKIHLDWELVFIDSWFIG